MTESFWQTRFLGNTLLDYALFAGTLVAGLLVLGLLAKVVLPRLQRWTEKSATWLDDFLVRTFRTSVMPLLVFGLVALGLRNLTLHPILARALDVIGVVLLTYVGVRFLASFTEHLLTRHWAGRPQAGTNTTQAILPAVHVLLWGLGILYLLENLGFKISAVIAGLGIGGIAVALAAQAVLKDAFSYFAILLDRPFEVGDFIESGKEMGTVEHVGVKTTRIRSLSGEQIVCANSDLTDSRLRNYKRMETRRIAFTLNVSYETPRSRVAAIPGMLAAIIKGVPHVRLDRAHFASYGDFSLRFEVVYYVLDSDYNLFMDIQQVINLRIMETFEREGIRFAIPVQRLYVSAEGGAGLPPAAASGPKTEGA